MISYLPEVEEAIISAQDHFVWEAPSHTYHERTSGWYLAASIVALLFVAYAVWTANFLFAFIILLMAMLVVLGGTEKPHQVLCQIGDTGIVWAGKLHPYNDIEQFAVVYQPPIAKVLYIDFNSTLKPRLRIPLEDQDPLDVRNHLLQYLTEDLDLQSEHLSDIVARVLKI